MVDIRLHIFYLIKYMQTVDSEFNADNLEQTIVLDAINRAIARFSDVQLNASTTEDINDWTDTMDESDISSESNSQSKRPKRSGTSRSRMRTIRRSNSDSPNSNNEFDHISEISLPDEEYMEEDIESQSINDFIQEENQCPICAQSFNNEFALVDHQMIVHENVHYDNYVQIDPESIPTNCDGLYECPICQNRYNNIFQLSQHFEFGHGNDYEELSTLDETEESGNFPGFDVLEKIGFIVEPGKQETINLIKSDKCCSLCYDNFSKCTGIPLHCKDYIDGYSSDSEEDIINYEQYSSVCDCDINRQSAKRWSSKRQSHRISKPIHLQFHELCERQHMSKSPLLVSCCSTYVCKECIILYTENNIDLTCPFCRRDLEDIDELYVTITEPEKHNKKSWKKWWRRHLEIFE